MEENAPATNLGDFPIPHERTFASIINTIGQIYSYRYDEALRHLPTYALAMRRDAYVQALLQERYVPTRNRTWRVEPRDKSDPLPLEQAAHLNGLLERTPRWGMLVHSLLEALWYGRAGAQIRYRRTATGWVIADHKPVNGDKIQFQWDGTPAVAVQSGYSFPGLTLVPHDRFSLALLDRHDLRRQFIVHRHEVDDADYFLGEMAGGIQGVGLRSRIYWCWWLRGEMLSWATDYMKKVGTLGMLIFWYEQGNVQAKAKAEQAVLEVNTRAAIAMPRTVGDQQSAWGVQQIPAGTEGITALQSMISGYFESHMQRLIVGQSLSSGTEGGGLGGTGVAKLHADTKFQLLKSDAENLQGTLTTDLVRVLAQLNGYEADAFHFVYNIENPEAAEKLNGVRTAVSMGVKFDEDEVRDLTGLGSPRLGMPTIGGEQGQAGGQPSAIGASAQPMVSGETSGSAGMIEPLAPDIPESANPVPAESEDFWVGYKAIFKTNPRTGRDAAWNAAGTEVLANEGTKRYELLKKAAQEEATGRPAAAPPTPASLAVQQAELQAKKVSFQKKWQEQTAALNLDSDRNARVAIAAAVKMGIQDQAPPSGVGEAVASAILGRAWTRRWGKKGFDMESEDHHGEFLDVKMVTSDGKISEDAFWFGEGSASFRNKAQMVRDSKAAGLKRVFGFLYIVKGKGLYYQPGFSPHSGKGGANTHKVDLTTVVPARGYARNVTTDPKQTLPPVLLKAMPKEVDPKDKSVKWLEDYGRMPKKDFEEIRKQIADIHNSIRRNKMNEFDSNWEAMAEMEEEGALDYYTESPGRTKLAAKKLAKADAKATMAASFAEVDAQAAMAAFIEAYGQEALDKLTPKRKRS